MFTANRDRAKVIGFVFHFLNGWLFTLLYALFFKQFGFAAWWLGGLLGIAHAAFVLVGLLPLLPSGHPRMASEVHGPDSTLLLEPPGFLALNYGYQTPIVTLIAHLAYGLVLGSLYRP